jgi:hypothetical protein
MVLERSHRADQNARASQEDDERESVARETQQPASKATTQRDDHDAEDQKQRSGGGVAPGERRTRLEVGGDWREPDAPPQGQRLRDDSVCTHGRDRADSDE